MSNYTVDEMRTAFPHELWPALFDGGIGYKAALLLRDEPLLIEVVSAKEIDTESNYSESVFVVVSVGTQYFRKEGYWESYSGTKWYGNLKEVTPKIKVVTVYE